MITITRQIAEKVRDTVAAGLSHGLGHHEPGQMCVEAAVCYALGLPHGDDPGCVSPSLRRLKIGLNDRNWSSRQARAAGLRRLAIAQLGSLGALDDSEFCRRVIEMTIRKSVPSALRSAAKVNPTHAEALERAAVRCEQEGTRESAQNAAYAAAAYAAAYADAAAYAAFEHYQFCIREVFRVTKPGRHTCVHVAEVTSTFATHGVIGLIDFPGKVIAAYQAAGWTYHGRVTIDKDPQAQAIRTHSKGLLFVQMRKDSTWSRPALADTILIFRKPGENAVPVTHDTPESSLTNDEWIEWARPIWYGIRESDTLNVQQARSEKDERHICPLQLGTIERCIRLWSNPGDLILSPFAGIGSEGYEAVRLGRRYIGFELKPEYATVAVKNLQAASEKKTQGSLFAVEATA